MTEKEIKTAAIDYVINNNEVSTFINESKNVAFIEGAKWALSNQWISSGIDSPCLHKELLNCNNIYTKDVLVHFSSGKIALGYMIMFNDGTWKWSGNINKLQKSDWLMYWMPIPQIQKEKIK